MVELHNSASWTWLRCEAERKVGFVSIRSPKQGLGQTSAGMRGAGSVRPRSHNPVSLRASQRLGTLGHVHLTGQPPMIKRVQAYGLDDFAVSRS
jgi:hypothetical protein